MALAELRIESKINSVVPDGELFLMQKNLRRAVFTWSEKYVNALPEKPPLVSSHMLSSKDGFSAAMVATVALYTTR